MRISFEKGELDVHIGKDEVDKALTFFTPVLTKALGFDIFEERQHDHGPATRPTPLYLSKEEVNKAKPSPRKRNRKPKTS